MRQLYVEPSGYPVYTDHVLVGAVLLLTGLGLVTLYSSSYAFAERFFGDSRYFISRQLLLGLFGLVLFFLITRIKMERLRRWIKPMVLLALVLCILTFVPGVGVMKNGAARWIRLGGYTYQPSELVKLVLPLYLAHFFDKKQDRLDSFTAGILPPVLITALFFILIYLENNFSTAVFIAANVLFIFYLAGVKLRYFFGVLAVLFPLSSFLILTKEHRLRRLISFIWPDWEPLGAGYQVHASQLTIGSGGFWGKGIGQGTRKIASVPEIHSDFIFSSYAEEAGFMGVFLFYTLFIVFSVQGYRAALGSKDMFRRLAAFGMVTMISSQALLNIAVTSGVLPATGIPLPFFSAGGSSLATTLLMAGLVVNVSRSAREPEVKYGR
jgi:cell division protein FtsW